MESLFKSILPQSSRSDYRNFLSSVRYTNQQGLQQAQIPVMISRYKKEILALCETLALKDQALIERKAQNTDLLLVNTQLQKQLEKLDNQYSAVIESKKQLAVQLHLCSIQLLEKDELIELCRRQMILLEIQVSELNKIKGLGTEIIDWENDQLRRIKNDALHRNRKKEIDRELLVVNRMYKSDIITLSYRNSVLTENNNLLNENLITLQERIVQSEKQLRKTAEEASQFKSKTQSMHREIHTLNEAIAKMDALLKLKQSTIHKQTRMLLTVTIGTENQVTHIRKALSISITPAADAPQSTNSSHSVQKSRREIIN